MALSLSEKRRRLDELGREGIEAHSAEVMQLAFELYDPQYARLIRKANEMRRAANSSSELEPIESDKAQQGFLKKCTSNIPFLSDERKDEVLHECLMNILTDSLQNYRSELGTLTKFLEYRLKYDVVDWVRREFGRTKKELEESEEAGESKEKPCRFVSLSAPVNKDDDGSPELGDLLPSGENSQETALEEADRSAAKALELMALELFVRADRDRSRRFNAKTLDSYRVMYTSSVIDLEHDGQNPPDYRYRSRVEDALAGGFADFCLDDAPGASLRRIHHSPIRDQYYRPLKTTGRQSPAQRPSGELGRLVGQVKDTAGSDYLGVSKSTYSEKLKKYRSVVWDILVKNRLL